MERREERKKIRAEEERTDGRRRDGQWSASLVGRCCTPSIYRIIVIALSELVIRSSSLSANVAFCTCRLSPRDNKRTSQIQLSGTLLQFTVVPPSPTHHPTTRHPKLSSPPPISSSCPIQLCCFVFGAAFVILPPSLTRDFIRHVNCLRDPAAGQLFVFVQLVC